MKRVAGFVSGAVLIVSTLQAQPTTQPQVEEPRRLEEVVVRGRSDSLIGIAGSASEGTIGAEQLEKRPLLRPGEVVETVPGAIITQHSGAGKANQFFLRGFNLDHGTDFATHVNGMPINMPTHGHGQGYTDLNFMIPELIETVNFMKGPYHASEGDFSSAGAIHIDYFSKMDRGLALIEGGMNGYARTVVADSFTMGGGDFLYGVELYHNDGPWDNPDNFLKYNLVGRYTYGDMATEGWRTTFMSYTGHWDATDQVAQRAINSGQIDEWGTLDDTSGGRSQRHSISMDLWDRNRDRATNVTLYGFYYSLNLWSNFTYALNDEVDGDQFLQLDERFVFGAAADHSIYGEIFGRPMENTIGVQVRNDIIQNGLHNTDDRSILSTVREDDVWQPSLGIYLRNKTQWADKVRTVAGVRGDFYYFDVDSDNSANSGDEFDAIFSPKGSIIFGPWNDTELYLSGGYGFHSNDGRGTTTTIDPATGDPVDRVDPLVPTRGGEVGVRTTIIPGLQSTVAAWILDIDSELLFIGDAGTTEASRPSRRYGIEFANYYTPNDWLTLDLDYSLSHSELRDDDPAGDDIPGSLESVLAAGIAIRDRSGWFGSLRARYFGPRPLIEDGSIESDSSCLVDAEVGYQFNETWTLRAQFFNLFDQDMNDIEYYYASRIPGEAPGPDEGGYNDIHLHPAEPFSFRIGLIARF